MYVQIYVKSGYNTTEVFERVKTYIELHYNITVEGYVHSTKGGFLSSVGSIFFSLISWPALLIASILLSIGLIQAIFEDVRQIGIRKALGFTNRQIIVYYMIMGIILYSIGSVIGILASYVVSYSALLILSKLLGEIKFVLNLSAVLRNILIGFIIAVFASLIPAMHVTKINPNHAIKYGIEKLEFARKKTSRVRNYPLSVRLAWRNISRRKKRGIFLISVLVLANISTFSLTFFATSIINTYYTVMGDVYQWDVSLGFNKPINLTVLKSVYEIDGVEKVEGGNSLSVTYKTLKIFVNNECRLSNAYRSLTLHGINISGSLIRPLIVEGQNLSSNSEGIIITTNLARRLNIKVGDTIRISGKVYEEELYINATFRVVGIGVEVFNDGWLFYITIDRFAEIANISKDSYYNLYVKIKEGYSHEKVLRDISRKLMSNGLSSLMTKKHILLVISDALNIFAAFIYLLVGIVNAVTFTGIFAVLYLIVHERRREIAILKSIGTTKSDIIKIMLTEIFLLATIVILISIYPAISLSNLLMSTIAQTQIDIVVIPTSNIFIYLLIPLHAFGAIILGYALPLRKLLREKPSKIFKDMF